MKRLIISLIVINSIIIILYPCIDKVYWTVQSIIPKIILHILSSWLMFIFYFDRINYDEKGNRLTDDLINEYKEQDRLDKESCFDQTT